MSSFQDQPPTPCVLLTSLRNTGYTLESAIADIIDNSITAQATRISVQYRRASGASSNQPWVAICDNGMGMTEEELFQNMKFGSREGEEKRVGRDAYDLGRFGLGMKTASISQCRKLTVATWQDGVCHAKCWDLDKISTSWTLLELTSCEIEGNPVIAELLKDLEFDVRPHGTCVIWESIDRDFARSDRAMNEAMDIVNKHISLVFHRFMVKEDGYAQIITFDINRRKLAPFPPFGPEDNKFRYILQPEEFICHGCVVRYEPYILPRSVNYANAADYERYAGREGYQQNQGFYVYRNRRLIEKATWFRQRKKEYKTQLLRIKLDIPAELDEFWGIDVRKSQITPPRDIRERVDRIVESAMQSARGLWDSSKRPTNIVRGNATPIWVVEKRSNNGDAFSYRVNTKHDMYRMLMEHVDADYKMLFREYIASIASTFPYERFFSDRTQNDALRVENDTDDDQRLVNLINYLSDLGQSEAEIRRYFMENETEFPLNMIDEFINYKYGI